MLILSRKVGESIIIDGRIIIKVVRVEGDQIKIGIQASRDVPVHRQEVYDEIQKTNQGALTRQGQPLPRLAPPAPGPTKNPKDVPATPNP